MRLPCSMRRAEELMKYGGFQFEDYSENESNEPWVLEILIEKPLDLNTRFTPVLVNRVLATCCSNHNVL